jgi:hypothetical protein
VDLNVGAFVDLTEGAFVDFTGVAALADLGFNRLLRCSSIADAPRRTEKKVSSAACAATDKIARTKSRKEVVLVRNIILEAALENLYAP